MDRIRADSRESPLNAAPADQLRLLDLQGLDARIDQLAHRRRNLAEHAEADRLANRLAQIRDLIVAAETEEGDIAREQAKAEADVDQVRSRSERDRRRLDSGQVGSAKDLENLQHEIGSLDRRQSELEDTVLEIMERREAAQERVRELRDKRERAESELTATEQRRDALLAEIDGEVATIADERKTVAAEIPEDLLALYEKLRDQHGGVGAAPLRRGRCEGCNLELDVTDVNRIRNAPPDAVVRCEECRRILIRTPESGL